MHVVTVTFVVAPEHLEDFMALMIDNAKRSLSVEPGCQRFDVCKHPERTNEVFLYEIYEDAAAFDAHKKMPHYLEFSESVEPMVTSKSVQTYSLIES